MPVFWLLSFTGGHRNHRGNQESQSTVRWERTSLEILEIKDSGTQAPALADQLLNRLLYTTRGGVPGGVSRIPLKTRIEQLHGPSPGF